MMSAAACPRERQSCTAWVSAHWHVSMPAKGPPGNYSPVETARRSELAHARLATTFRALKHRNYKLWFFGQGLSLIGTWMQTMAQQVLVYRLTGSAVALGIFNFMVVLQ